MVEYKFGKKIISNKATTQANIRVYCGCKYEYKEHIKKLGAKFDMNLKSWYFDFDADELYKNDKLCTFGYKPHTVRITGTIKNNVLPNHLIIDDIHDLINFRNDMLKLGDKI